MAQLTQRRIADLAELDLPTRTTTLVINGETSDDPGFPSDEVRRALTAVIGELSKLPGPVIVSGGTDAGVFALLGSVVAELGFAGPVIGVVPAGKIDKPDGTPLEPHHTDIVMVDGDDWGDETPTMLALCRQFDRRGPVVALIAGGGEQTVIEIDGHLADGRPVVTLRGSGRAADQASDQSTGETRAVAVENVRAIQDVMSQLLSD